MAAPQGLQKPITFNNRTLRQTLHITAGGTSLRVRLSNLYGSKALTVDEAHVALNDGGNSTVSQSDRVLTFSGQGQVTLAPGQELWSDAVPLSVHADQALSVSLYFAGPSDIYTFHREASETSFIGVGNQTSLNEQFNSERATTFWYVITDVEVSSPRPIRTIVTLGDSITDGVGSTLDSNARWPSQLADRLRSCGGAFDYSVLNAGIGFNMILREQTVDWAPSVSALSRFERDVLSHPDVEAVIVVEGINDIGLSGPDAPLSVHDLEKGMLELVARAHARHVKVFAGTVLPFIGAGYFTVERETIRSALNTWIRHSRAFDGVIDFEQAMTDPLLGGHLNHRYDGGDHLHPNDLGYQAMAKAVDIRHFCRP